MALLGAPLLSFPLWSWSVFCFFLPCRVQAAIVSRDFSCATPWVAALVPAWARCWSRRCVKSIRRPGFEAEAVAKVICLWKTKTSTNLVKQKNQQNTPLSLNKENHPSGPAAESSAGRLKAPGTLRIESWRPSRWFQVQRSQTPWWSPTTSPGRLVGGAGGGFLGVLPR